MKLNWFSPLLPAKTDVAHYTLRVVSELSKHIEIVLWTDSTEWDRKLEQYAQIEHYQLNFLSWSEINSADINIYHIGNNAKFHRVIWEISRKCPGIIVLHDLKLHDFFASIYREKKQDKNAYFQEMIRYYGRECKQVAEDFWQGRLTTEFMTEHYPLTPLAIEDAVGAIVHNKEAYQILSEQNHFLLGYTSLPYASKIDRQKERSANKSLYRLIVFGYINTNRRLESILEALADLPEKNRFYLDIYGELWHDNYIRQRIEHFRLNKLVKIHGFVSEDVLETALSNADLAINLRYPTMGEASGSQLRIWSHALPSLVTKIGWYATLPEDTVIFIEPNREIEDIQQQLRNLLLKPEEFFEIGKRGKKFLQQHHAPEAYAQAIINFAEQALKYRAYPSVNYAVKKVGEEMANWGKYNLLKEQIENTAEAISHLIL